MTEQIIIPIGIVDDHTLFRNGLAKLLKEFSGLRITFEAGNGQAMQEMMVQNPATRVILMDINMPVMDGYRATTWLKANHPHVKVLALSMFEDDDAVIGMIRAGARGYVLKESNPSDLRDAITAVDAKGIFLNEMVSGKLYRSVSDVAQTVGISGRELEFLKLTCSELTYKEIADQMNLSPRTIDNYREILFLKLGLKSRTGLVLYAIKHKVVIL